MSLQNSEQIEKHLLFNKKYLPFKKNRILQIIIFLFLIGWVLTAIRPANWTYYLLENIPMGLIIIILSIFYKRLKLSNFSYLLIALFFLMNAFGAHYDYGKTPIDEWLKDTFEIKEKYYDLIVHFGYGLLMAYPIKELLFQYTKLYTFWLYIFIFSLIVSLSGTFEIIEMLVNKITNPNNPEKHLGLHHDPFNTQKDMSMAWLGTFLAIVIMIIVNSRKKTIE
ncbi:DUF2238 domain-containing protein [Metabacillus fastidiosus]|uniref:DUF2238 domain-containing protein n=1 Tax=Metabacillus fastidiosus TaxID=1458 RepID=UPI002E23B101|nr:DUF2238 domain-containing protein [Metabacillus fastidiosus]